MATPPEVPISSDTKRECAILSPVPSPADLTCTEHTKQELKLYCEKCKKLICIECAIDGAEHYSHKPVMLEKTCDQYKREILESLVPMKKQLTAVRNALIEVDRKYGEISQQQEAIEAEIYDIAKQIHWALDARTTELIVQLHQCTHAKLKGLSSQKDEIKTALTKYQQCEETVEEKLNTGSDQDIVTTKESIIGKIENLTSSFQPDHLKPSADANLKFTLGDVTSACRGYGAIIEPEIHPDASMCVITAKSMGSLEVAQKASVLVRTVDCNGELYEEEIQSLECEFVSELTGSKSVISFDRREKSLYELGFMPTVKGRHQLHIKIGNQAVTGFPLSVAVKQPFEKIGIPISTITDVKTPWGVAVNQKGEIIVTEQSKHCISVLSPKGIKIRSFSARGSEKGSLNEPSGIAVDRNGDILVADSNNHRIQKFTANGTFLEAVGSKGSGYLQFKKPQSLTFNAFNEKVYVVDSGNNRIQVLDHELNFHSILEGHGTENLMLYNPWGITCDKYGRIYVADCKNSRIIVLTAEGTFLRMTGKFIPNLASNRKFGPVGMAIDDNGVLYVSNHLSRQVSTMTFNDSPEDCNYGCPTDFWGGKGNSPHGLAVDTSGVLYVCDYSKDRIVMF